MHGGRRGEIVVYLADICGAPRRLHDGADEDGDESHDGDRRSLLGNRFAARAPTEAGPFVRRRTADKLMDARERGHDDNSHEENDDQAPCAEPSKPQVRCRHQSNRKSEDATDDDGNITRTDATCNLKPWSSR